MKQSNRFIEVDLFRGIILIGMIIFHIFYILDYFQILANEMYEGAWLILMYFVQIGFIGIVGISLVLSYKKFQLKTDSKRKFLIKQWKRGIMVLGWGIIISLTTYIFIPENYVKFGILHLIGVSILIFSFIADKKYIALMVGTITIALSFFLETIKTKSLFLFIIGFKGIGIQSLDYFPIFPWIGVVALGIFLGHLIYRKFKAKFKIKSKKLFNPINLISFLGKHTLLIYLIHIPLIILTLISLRIIKLEDLFL